MGGGWLGDFKRISGDEMWRHCFVLSLFAHVVLLYLFRAEQCVPSD